MRYQYQGTPATPPPPTLTPIAGTISGNAGTYHFWLVIQNRAGFSRPSARVSFTVAPNSGVAIAIPASARPAAITVAGEPIFPCDCRNFLVLLGVDTSPDNAIVVASYPGYEGDRITPRALPATLALTEDDHLSLALTVPTPGQLPSNPSPGQRRIIADQNQIVSWNNFLGQWDTVVPQVVTPVVVDATASTGAVGGANRDLALLNDPTTLIYPDYAVDGSESEPVRFWLVNDTEAVVAAGRAIALSLSANLMGNLAEPVDLSLFPGLVGRSTLRFLGYVNTTTGALDIDGAVGIGEPVPYVGPEVALSLPKPLLPGMAYLLEFSLSTTPDLLNNRLPQGTTLRISPSLYENLATPNPAALLLGSVILGEQERRRILPSTGLDAIARVGSGVLRYPAGQGFSFWEASEQVVVNLIPDTANQKIAITINGDCLVVDQVGDLAELRAIAGTVNGIGQPTPWRSVTLSNANYLDITITYPAAIRPDYPDVVAGMAAPLNASFLRVYLRAPDNSLLYWDYAIAGGSQTHRVGGVAGTVAASLPPDLGPNFGLFALAEDNYTEATPAGSAVFDAQTYEYCVAFIYANTLTQISHSPALGCLPEAGGTLSEVFELLKYYRQPIGSLTALAGIDRSTLYNGAIFPVAASNGKTRIFAWNASSTASPDGTSVIQLLDGLPGRFTTTSDRQPLESPATLADIDRSILYNGAIVPVAAPGDEIRIFVWNAASTASPDGISVVQLADGLPGRFTTTTGSIIHSGSLAAPGIDLGFPGDYYLSTAEPVSIFGPKTSTSWGEGIPLKADNLLVPSAKTFAGGAYTLALADLEKGLIFSGATSGTVTIPNNSVVPFPIGAQIMIGRQGSGTIAINGAAGVLINGTEGGTPRQLSEQWSVASLWKTGENQWWIFGGLD